MTTFGDIAGLADRLAIEGSRLKKRAAIAQALLGVSGVGGVHEAGLFAMYLAGQPFAEHDGRKLNAGGALLSRAVLKVSGASDAALGAAYRRHGDLGAAAADVWPDLKSAEPLTLDQVAQAFAAMAVARSTAARAGLVEALLRQASRAEAKYLLKLMLGDMRIGVKQSLVEEAIAVAAEAEVVALRHAVMLEADLARAVERAFAGTLAEARMTLFHPLGFMLASPVETSEEAVARFTEAPKKVIAPKSKRKGKAKDVAAVNAAEEGFAEDVESGEADPSAALRDDNKSGTLRSDDKSGTLRDDSNSVPLRDDDDSGALRDGNQSAAPGVLAFLEDKYDGMRAQLHCGDSTEPGRVAIYSRNREDVTQSFPELAEAFALIDEPLILDGEILGWDYTSGVGHGAGDRASGQALPFAIMGQRIGRKLASNELRTQIPVVFMAFDVLYQGGELLLPLPLTERRARLETVVERWRSKALSPLVKRPAAKLQGGLFPLETGGGDSAFSHDALQDGASEQMDVERLLLSPARRVADAAAIDQAYRDARDRKNEGVMLKAANSAYLPGRRGLAWVKLKRELATLDVVITGAEFGHGKRAGLLSDYTFAVRGDAGELLNVGKAYSGVTDAEIAELTEWLKAHTLEEFGHFRTVEPQIVLEVAFNNIMRSDRHASGFAMRFPRIIRIRTDKPVEEIDTLARVEQIYQSQPDRAGE